MVNNKYRKARKFESGLRGPIQDRVNMLNMPTYARVLDKAILAEANLSRSQSSGENQRKRQDYDNRQAPSDVNKKVNVDNSSNSNQESGTRPTYTSCGKQHFGACYWVSGACFECGEMGHRIKDCPKVKAKDDKKK
ncbi:glycine-rich RNA-binding protein RZ1C-like [Camellia sinensis]|uniref:glycine-rich RNA-binding protein RZ1C-like n=1 Tax=Camellia sinensis TaxID=4442 RepID=UPI0010357F99|nr:glycine-rich RNA-binding protein RZ1C-like [Camellia sinensis]